MHLQPPSDTGALKDPCHHNCERKEENTVFKRLEYATKCFLKGIGGRGVLLQLPGKGTLLKYGHLSQKALGFHLLML